MIPSSCRGTKALWEKKLRSVCKRKYCRNRLVSLLEDTDVCLDILSDAAVRDTKLLIDIKTVHSLQKIMRLLLKICSLQ